MLNRYRAMNEWPTVALLDYEAPGRTIGTLRKELERVLGSCERSLNGPFAQFAENAQLRDSGSSLIVTVDLPGVSKQDVELSVSGDNVFIRASRTLSSPDGYTAHRRERSSFRFEHAIKLPVPVELEHADAKLEHGILTVTLPKSPAAQPRQIAVSAD